MKQHLVFFIFLFTAFIFTGTRANNITAYAPVVDTIFKAALADTVGYERLEYLCNTYGARLSGTTTLENAIDWVVSEMQKDGFDSVTTEAVTVTNVPLHLFSKFKLDFFNFVT